jgi:hypothetical protein
MYKPPHEQQIPLSIILDVVSQQNNWELVLYNNSLCIKKHNYYYTTESSYQFKGKPSLETNTNMIYLGEYKPLMLDSNNFSSLPIVINNNNFIVNKLTNIVYVKSKELVILIPHNTPYDFELYATYSFAGNYNPYLNSRGTSSKLFVDMIPNSIIKQKKVIEPKSIVYSDPLENTLSDNPYPINPKTEVLDQRNNIALANNTMVNINMTTFLIPFIDRITTNINSLIRGIESIIKHVDKYRIIVVTSKQNLKIPEHLQKCVMILPYTRYISKMGYENKLNIIMQNDYDVSTFYNFLISNYVKTSFHIIWNYNWEIESWNNSNMSSKTILVPNYYLHNGNLYKSSRGCRFGYLLYGKNKYITTNDLFDVVVNGLGIRELDQKIVVKGIYDDLDVLDRKNMLLYGNELEMRDFYDNISNGLNVNYVEKII